MKKTFLLLFIVMGLAGKGKLRADDYESRLYLSGKLPLYETKETCLKVYVKQQNRFDDQGLKLMKEYGGLYFKYSDWRSSW